MLSTSRSLPVLLSTDLASAKHFYADLMGLPIEEESESSITFSCGHGTGIRISKSDEGTKDSQTQVDLVVDDVRSEVSELKQRGIEVEHYDTDDVTTDADGVADQGEAWVAWITDPGGNVLGLEEPKRR